MLFNSLDFAVFLPLVFTAYWLLSKYPIKYQNVLLFLSSYLFYGWWDSRFLVLILFSTVLDFYLAKSIEKQNSKENKKKLLYLSLLFNLGFLCFFKYCNFFVDNFVDAFTFFGSKLQISRLDIILPVGISFYTFQTLSYTIDVYRGKLKASDDFISFAAFVSFFPQLVAGPIERATNLLPQFYKKRSFNTEKSINGIKQIIWGLFKKIVIADTCAQYANEIFNNFHEYSSLTLILGTIYFSFQIYCDFSGYSDIAIGTAKLFGFSLMKNFSFPYFSRNIGEFWRRWHISLTTWFRDYIYIPLGGSRGNNFLKLKNTLIVFVVSGFWHGANWTFVFWGLLNALYFIPSLLTGKNRKYVNSYKSTSSYYKSLIEFFKALFTYILICSSWIFFRAENISNAFGFISNIIKWNFKIERIGIERFSFELIPLIILLLSYEWYFRDVDFPFDSPKKSYIGISVLIALIVLFGNYSDAQEFIYFKF